MNKYLKVWYVAPQRLCNFNCEYCVSTGEYSKSNKKKWENEGDVDNFKKVIDWIISIDCRIKLRLGTLGEPFTSYEFMRQVSLLTNKDNIEFVELLTNGSLLKQRLPVLDKQGVNFNKLTLWASFHPKQISIERFFDNILFAREKYGCNIIINGLLFPESINDIIDLKKYADMYTVDFNLDLGYDPKVPAEVFDKKNIENLIPITKEFLDLEKLEYLGVNKKMVDVNFIALKNPKNQLCSAGHNYICISIKGDVYPCSRYYVLNEGKLGNILDDDKIVLLESNFSRCKAKAGCCNKEDFLNLKMARELIDTNKKSIGCCKK